MTKTDPRPAFLQVRMTSDEKARLMALARSHGMTASQLVRLALLAVERGGLKIKAQEGGR